MYEEVLIVCTRRRLTPAVLLAVLLGFQLDPAFEGAADLARVTEAGCLGTPLALTSLLQSLAETRAAIVTFLIIKLVSMCSKATGLLVCLFAAETFRIVRVAGPIIGHHVWIGTDNPPTPP